MPVLKMFYDGQIYKRFNFCGKKDALNWMKVQTEMTPTEKRRRIYFEIRSMRKCHESEKKLTK